MFNCYYIPKTKTTKRILLGGECAIQKVISGGYRIHPSQMGIMQLVLLWPVRPHRPHLLGISFFFFGGCKTKRKGIIWVKGKDWCNRKHRKERLPGSLLLMQRAYLWGVQMVGESGGEHCDRISYWVISQGGLRVYDSCIGVDPWLCLVAISKQLGIGESNVVRS